MKLGMTRRGKAVLKEAGGMIGGGVGRGGRRGRRAFSRIRAPALLRGRGVPSKPLWERLQTKNEKKNKKS